MTKLKECPFCKRNRGELEAARLNIARLEGLLEIERDIRVEMCSRREAYIKKLEEAVNRLGDENIRLWNTRGKGEKK